MFVRPRRVGVGIATKAGIGREEGPEIGMMNDGGRRVGGGREVEAGTRGVLGIEVGIEIARGGGDPGVRVGTEGGEISHGQGRGIRERKGINYVGDR